MTISATTTRLRFSARSDIGLRRKGNEDSGFAGDGLLMVADGMGGHAAGELASALAVATFAEIAAENVPEDELLERLEDGIDLLGERIADHIAQDPSNEGMGTTVTALAWLGNRVALVHVGDSRAYLLRGDQLVQMTKDHTYVQSLVDAGQITAEEAVRHPRRNLLNRAVDGIHPVESDLSVREIRSGDRVLLCTDGLSGVVPDTALAEVLRSVSDPTGAVTRLVDMALEAGAPDNVTVVVADVANLDRHYDGGRPVVVGAAGEPGNRAKLPDITWPADEQIDPNRPLESVEIPAQAGSLRTPEGRDDLVPVAHHASTRSWRRATMAIVAVVVAAFALVGVALTWWLSQQWYVGQNTESVAIYHGVQGSLGPIPLQRLEGTSDLPVATLPDYDRTRLQTGVIADSKASAESIVTELRVKALECQIKPKEAGCPPAP